ncbi:unnamed protein product [Chilo suppressalis]|uniref:MULE transposase domain-containing protein n=1 Tax=Chilo suppressalis TaxID=168631 RepID=A0ABN8B5H1_CHISP|nr:unnamed protein product [Chilo suppressalis]
MVYKLLPDKCQETYTRLLYLIKKHFPNFNPHSFKIDYEMAMANAIQTVFQSAKITGCYFHYTNAIKKSEVVRDEVSHQKFIQLCYQLPHLPETYIPEGFMTILHQAPEGKATVNFVKYFTKQWLSSNKPTICCYKQKHKTNNIAEGWHSRINKRIKRKPGLLHFIQMLDKEAKIQNIRVFKKIHQLQSNARRRKHLLKETRIGHIEKKNVNEKVSMRKGLNMLRRLNLG